MAKEFPLPRAEWPKHGGVSEASTFGWDEEPGKPKKWTWWDRMDMPSFTEKVVILNLESAVKLHAELTANIASINIQLLNSEKRCNYDWLCKAKAALQHVASKRKVVGQHLSKMSAGGMSIKKKMRVESLMGQLKEAKMMFSSNPEAAFTRLTDSLAEFFAPIEPDQ